MSEKKMLRLVMETSVPDDATGEARKRAILQLMEMSGDPEARIIASYTVPDTQLTHSEIADLLAIYLLAFVPDMGSDDRANILAVNALTVALGTLLVYPLAHPASPTIGGEGVIDTVLDHVRMLAHEGVKALAHREELHGFTPNGVPN